MAQGKFDQLVDLQSEWGLAQNDNSQSLEIAVRTFRWNVSAKLFQQTMSDLNLFSDVKAGKPLDWDLFETTGFDSLQTSLNAGKNFIQNIEGELAKFSAKIKEIEAKIPSG